jgi:hypothetical protein
VTYTASNLGLLLIVVYDAWLPGGAPLLIVSVNDGPVMWISAVASVWCLRPLRQIRMTPSPTKLMASQTLDLCLGFLTDYSSTLRHFKLDLLLPLRPAMAARGREAAALLDSVRMRAGKNPWVRRRPGVSSRRQES